MIIWRQVANQTYDGLHNDFYLRLVGEATRLIRGEIKPSDDSLIGKYAVKKAKAKP